MSKGGKYVRRHDKNGNPYFVDRSTGRRVSRVKWERDRSRVRREQERAPKPTRTPQRPPATAPAPVQTPPAPFPPGVAPPGRPVAPTTPDKPRDRSREPDEYEPPDDFEWDFDAFEVDGDDDTGGA